MEQEDGLCLLVCVMEAYASGSCVVFASWLSLTVGITSVTAAGWHRQVHNNLAGRNPPLELTDCNNTNIAQPVLAASSIVPIGSRPRARVRALWGLSGWRGNERIADSIKKGPPEREREEAAVPEAIERLISRGPPAGSGIPFEAWRSWHRYGSLPVRPRSFGIPVPTIAAGWALIAASWMGH